MATPSLNVGQIIGHYRIIEHIGLGGMGVVYRAHDEQLERDVALKVLPDGTLTDEAARRRFRKEAMALAKLNHPNIATVYEFGSDDRRDYLVMELIAGETLEQKLKSGPLPYSDIVRLGMQLAAALGAAHAQGIIHRDLKPANLIVTPQRLLKVLDFGLAAFVRTPATGDLTQSVNERTTVTGTLPYMSPEQLRSDPMDKTSDLYSAGAVLYEMATGRRAFPETQGPRLIDCILHEAPQRPSAINPQISRTLEKVILKALEKDPARRCQSAEEIHAALEGMTGAVVVPPTPTRRLPLKLAAGIAALLILAVLLLVRNVAYLRERWSSNVSKGTPATLPARASVAVLGFKNVSSHPDVAWISTGLSEMLTTELGAGEKLRMIPEETVARAKLDLSLSEADSYGPDTLQRLRSNLGSDYVVVGSYIDLGKAAGGQIRVDFRLQEARTGETITTASVTGKETELFDLVSKAGAQLRNKLGAGEISEADASLTRASLPVNSEAARYYSEGIGRLRVFDASAAADLLRNSIHADPNYAMAHSAMAAAWSALGYDQRAKDEAAKAFELSPKLSREDRLAIEGRYHESRKDWTRAIEVYRTLWTFFPDNLEYGLRLAAVQTQSGKSQDALATTAELRRLPAPASQDARIDLAEEAAARGLADFKRELAAATAAASKGEAQGSRLLLARAKLAEGRALYSIGDRKAAQGAAEEARQIFHEAGDRGGEATALHHIAQVLSDTGDPTAAMKMEEQVYSTCREIDDKRCMADTLNSRGVMLKDGANYPASLKAYEESIALRRDIGDRIGEAVSINNIAVLHFEQGRLAEAKRTYEKSLAISQELGEKRGIVRVLTNLGIVNLYLGELAESRRIQEQSLVMRRDIGDKTGIAIALNNLAELEFHQGDLAGAKARDDEQLAIERQSPGTRRGLGYALYVRGHILEAQGDLVGARQAQEEALEIRTKMGEKSNVRESRLALALLAIELGHAADAEQPVREVIVETREARAPDTEIAAEIILARSLLEQGKTGAAETEIKRAQELAAQSENRLNKIAVEIAGARVNAAQGKVGEARAQAQSALRDATSIGVVPYELEARLALGQTEMKSRNAVAGRAQLQSLAKDAKAKGFGLIATRAAALTSL